MSIQITHVSETSDSGSGSIIWSGGSKVLLLAVFQVNSDSLQIYIRNSGSEVMTFDLSNLKSDYKLDSSAFMLPIYMYFTNRWVIDFRSFNGLPPSGTDGIEIGIRSTSGTKTMNNAMVMWRDR